jgi:hypothetical protein
LTVRGSNGPLFARRRLTAAGVRPRPDSAAADCFRSLTENCLLGML